MSVILYTIGERVLAYHGPLIYEAKVLKMEIWTEETSKIGSIGAHYWVHYKGWKQTWDEWVPASRLLKYNDLNQNHQKSLQQAAAAQQKKAAAATSTSTAAGAVASTSKVVAPRKDGPTRGTKRGREGEADEPVRKMPEMKLNVPEILKTLLVDDWESVTKNNQTVTLPRGPTVAEILEEFKGHVLSLPPSPNLREPIQVLPVIISGLQVYFDKSLGQSLLYRFERPQYADVYKKYVNGPKVMVGETKEMSQIYGAEHLLRMLVSLPQMVALSMMDPESVGLVRDYTNELLAYMVEHRDRLFLTEYPAASIAYQNIGRA